MEDGSLSPVKGAGEQYRLHLLKSRSGPDWKTQAIGSKGSEKHSFYQKERLFTLRDQEAIIEFHVRT